MIFGNLQNISEYTFLEEQIQKCFRYVKENDIFSYEKGSYKIEGEKLFVNVVEYTTTEKENRFWEAHRQYLDVHIMLFGQERIDLNFIGNMIEKGFEAENDFVALQGEANSHVILTKDDFLICYPNDGHMTAIKVKEPITIKKAIFKVLIE